ncbi:Efflux transporter, RND family [Candidatus Magnetomoraceae bacterium gMMP-15]
MKTIKTIIIFLLIAIPVFAQPPAKVVVMKVTEKEIAKTNQIMGIVDFDKLSGISSEVSGLIDSQNIIEGTLVKKGDILVSLNIDFIKKDIQIMKLQASQTDIKIQNTRKNLKRYETLFKQDAASEKVYDDLTYTYRELRKERAGIQKKIEKLELEIQKSLIKAPFDGLILERYKNEGEWVEPGKSICSLASASDVFVSVAVSENMIKYIKPGKSISLIINAINKEFTGAVKNFVPVADLKTKTFEIKIAIPYFNEVLQNMSATVNVPASHEMKLKMIKRDALIKFQGKDFVYTVKDGQAKILPVNIVAYEGEYIGVDNPYIVVDMPVVIDGNDRLQPDQAVQIVEKG